MWLFNIYLKGQWKLLKTGIFIGRLHIFFVTVLVISNNTASDKAEIAHGILSFHKLLLSLKTEIMNVSRLIWEYQAGFISTDSIQITRQQLYFPRY